MMIYADWGTTKDWFYIRDDNESVESSSFENLLNLVDSNTEIFLETGVPKVEFLVPLLKKEVTVNLINADKISAKREKKGIEKTDKNDCLLIRDFANNSGKILITLKNTQDLENLKFKFFIKKYNQLNKTITRLKNIEKAYLSEYGFGKEPLISFLEKERESTKKVLERIFRTEISLFDDIKGISIVTVAKALLFSNPKSFSSLKKYICYTGFTESVKWTESGRLRKNPKRVPFYLMSEGIIKAKDNKWYKQYLKIKEDLKIKFPDDKPWLINNKAKNRISTLLAKEFYRRIRNQRKIQSRL